MGHPRGQGAVRQGQAASAMIPPSFWLHLMLLSGQLVYTSRYGQASPTAIQNVGLRADQPHVSVPFHEEEGKLMLCAEYVPVDSSVVLSEADVHDRPVCSCRIRA